VVADALSRNVSVAPVTVIPNFSLEQLRDEQRRDKLWSKVIYALESGDGSTLPHLPFSLSEFSLSDDGILSRAAIIAKNSVKQVVISNSCKDVVLKLLHDVPHAGHPGRDKCLTAARQKYYWPTMRIDIERHVAQCLSCAQHKGTTSKPAPILEYPTPDGPWDTIAIDLLQLPRSHQGSTHVLVCVDHFSRFVVLATLPNKSAEAVAHALVTHVFCPFTTPRVILSDNGAEFKNQVLEAICHQYDILQTFTVAYHPVSNGLVERTNRKILEILKHVVGSIQEAWEDWLPQVAASINGAINSATGKTPHYIVFGRDKRLPYDLLTQRPAPLYSVDNYTKTQLHAFAHVHASVREKIQASRAEMTYQQHKRAQPVTIDTSDTVMKSSPERYSKLTAKFTGPYLVVERVQGNKLKMLNSTYNITGVVHVDRL